MKDETLLMLDRAHEFLESAVSDADADPPRPHAAYADARTAAELAGKALLLHAPLDLFAPERLHVEVGRHVDDIARRANIDRVRALLVRLLDRVQMVPAALIAPHAAEAIRRCRRAGRNDAAYVACCLAIDAALWTHDRPLASEAGVDVVTTQDLAGRFLR